MATSTTELILKFRGDSADAKATLAQIRSELTKTGQVQKSTAQSELSTRQQLAAAASLQRQRSAALIAEWKRQEAAAKKLASDVRPVGENLQRITDIMQALGSSSATLQGPLGGVASRLRSIGALATEASGGLGLVGAAAGAATVAVGALAVVLVKTAIAAAEFQGKMFDLSQQTGVSVETLSTLEAVARTTGGDIDAIAQSLGLFQSKLEAAHDPTSEEATLLKRLGVETNNTEEALRQAIAGLARMSEGFEQTAAARDLFGGRGAKAFLAILKETGGDLDATTERLRKMGALITTEAAVAADKFNDRLAETGLQVRGLAAIIGNEAMPEIEAAVKAASQFITENRAVIVGWTRDMGDAARGAAALAGFVGELSTQVSGLNALPVPVILTILKSLDFTGISTLFRGLKSLGTPPIGPINVPGPTPDALPSQTVDPATAKQVSALKAANEAAKRVATERIAEQERLFKLGKITREQETENIIAQLRIRTASEAGAIDDEINLKLGQLQAEKDNATKRAQIIEQISNLQEQQKSLQSELDRSIADKRAELQIQERRNLAQHEKAKLDILLGAGQARIQLIEAEIRLGSKTAEDGNREIEQIENQSFAARLELLKKEMATLVDPGERQKVQDAIDKIEQERTANLQKQGERRIQIEQDTVRKTVELNRQLVRIRDVERDGEEARIKDLESKGFLSESQAIARRLALLTEAHNDRLTLINLELEQDSITAEKQTALINERIEAETRYTNEFEQLTQRRIEASVRERAALNPQLPEVGINQNPVDTSQLGLPPEATDTMIRQAAAAQGAFQGLGAAIATTIGLGQEAGAIFGEVLNQAFGSLAHAVGDAVHAFVLFGTAGEGLKKFSATLIAEIARMAAVEAVWNLAQGVAKLAMNFFWPDPELAAAAAFHFKAAAIFGGIAAIAATAGRAVAGGSFAQSSGGGSASGGGGGTQAAPAQQQGPTVIERDRNRVSAQPQITIVLNGDLSQFETRVERAVVKGVNNNSRPLQTAISRARGNS